MSFVVGVHAGPSSAVAELRAAYAEGRAALDEQVTRVVAVPGEASAEAIAQVGIALGRERARLVDDLLVRLFSATREPREGGWGASERSIWDEVALAAVGSYGRGAVALRSDLDLRIIARDVQEAATVVESLLYPLWDMGVSVGHQVVSIEDLIASARDDLPSATTLLDWRHLAGDRDLSESLWQRAVTGLLAHSELPLFIERLRQEVEQRHARFGGSVYLLEPDVKNGAGGLRDLDIARWASKARWGAGEVEALVRFGALVTREAAEIRAAEDTLWRLRNLLHAGANRRNDRLTFDKQEACAAALGYGAGDEAVERMMSDYYRSARTISRTLEMLLTRATPTLTRRRRHEEDLGGGLRLFDGCVALANPPDLRTDPALALRAFSVAVERGLPLLGPTREAIARASAEPAFCAALRESAEAAQRFLALLVTCKETQLKSGSPIREMHELGLLLAMIPEFSPVVGRVHHDVYHVYTVDVHSVAAVDRLAEVTRGDLAAEFGLPCRLAAEVSRPEVLFAATLLHDVGKAIGGTEHSQRGAEMAQGILARLGLPPQDVAEACHLILKHLVMYHVATRRDLDDPAAIAEFCREVNGREGLRNLYLLTVADLSTTSPTSMTSWKARMLDELYLAADASLAGQVVDDERLDRAVAEATRAVASVPLAEEAERAELHAFTRDYLASMPERYLLSNGAPAIAAHATVAWEQERSQALARVALVPSRHPEAAELCVAAWDRPGLLAALTAAIAASRLVVHAAQIHSRTTGAGQIQAVDLFWVRDRGDGVEGVARSIPKLVRDMHAVLSGEVEGAALVQQRAASFRERKSPRVRTQVKVDNRASPRHSVLEIFTRDRPGLLFTISDALYQVGLSIAVAKINTEGTRVADVFYVNEAGGEKIAPGRRTAEIRERIEAVLRETEREEGIVG
ncbi:[protein-PII] uridylyltransferase [Chondromyces crocatus]|uniref:Bifunctional uridylyltransferase/uridylyl-removing enzyme n=1 Tax=Chondromyces crocatus TaxID=52 RepID=A0A0K1EIJ6_CHOCO|nr:[protein-PII] uridylyltransferase [Chondromyces crocatus]AKT40680.1 (protein-PII) uridylyltransferase [Chondromyces crocatus]